MSCHARATPNVALVCLGADCVITSYDIPPAVSRSSKRTTGATHTAQATAQRYVLALLTSPNQTPLAVKRALRVPVGEIPESSGKPLSVQVRPRFVRNTLERTCPSARALDPRLTCNWLAVHGAVDAALVRAATGMTGLQVVPSLVCQTIVSPRMTPWAGPKKSSAAGPVANGA